LRQNGKSIDKIVGYPSNILPTLLINSKGQFDHEMGKLLIGYNQNGCKLNWAVTLNELWYPTKIW